jgi:DNA-binding MarR family transcriptional regulator
VKTADRHQQRLRFVKALNRMDSAWMGFLQDKDVFDINYSDLYTGLWASEGPVRKQEALQFMRHLGPQTAKKYLDNAIAKGLVVEVADPSDGRAKLIRLSADLKRRLEEFFDHAVELFREAVR